MKIALCLQGLSHGKSDKGIEVSFLDAAKMLKSPFCQKMMWIFLFTLGLKVKKKMIVLKIFIDQKVNL